MPVRVTALARRCGLEPQLQISTLQAVPPCPSTEESRCGGTSRPCATPLSVGAPVDSLCIRLLRFLTAMLSGSRRRPPEAPGRRRARANAEWLLAGSATTSRAMCMRTAGVPVSPRSRSGALEPETLG